MKRVYLDWAAAAPVSAGARRAFLNVLSRDANPSSSHAEGRAAASVLEEARVRIARLGGVKSDAVVFTSGATESNALAIEGFVRSLAASGRAASSVHALYLPSAHASTRGGAERLRALGAVVEPVPLTGSRIDLDGLKTLLRPETALIALEAVCGETGTRFDTRGVRRLLDQHKVTGERPRLHVDASQLPLAESFQLARLGADTLSLDSQKVGGIRGIGALLAPRQHALSPLVSGGGQERGLRPGTPPVALASAFAIALEEAFKSHESFVCRAALARARLIERITREVPDAAVNGEASVPHILNLSLPGRDTEYLAALLDATGFAVSTKSACSEGEQMSAAVLALTGDPERARATLRVSWGPSTPANAFDRFAVALVRAVRFLDANVL